MRKLFRAGILGCAGLMTLLASSYACAQTLAFRVLIDTSKIASSAGGEYALYLQLTDGSGIGNATNVITLSNFALMGGAWQSGSPGQIVLTDNAFFTQSEVGFQPGSLLSFDVAMTTNADISGTPDQFSFALLDPNQVEVPTLGLADALFLVDIDSANPILQTYRSDLTRTPLDIPAPILQFPQAVPEPGMISTFAIGLGVLGTLSLRRRRNA